MRRQRELARQQKQKDKRARREEKRVSRPDGSPGPASGDISPDDLISFEELAGIAPAEPPPGEDKPE